MRRKDRGVTDPAIIREIVAACTCCRLGLCDGERAYIVPLNFGFEERDGNYTLYFHGASEGRKIDLIRRTGWASFEMDTGHELIRGPMACNHSARYRCVMGGGPVRLLEDREEKREGLRTVMTHAAGEGPWTFDEAALDKTQVIRLDVEELTCKVRA